MASSVASTASGIKKGRSARVIFATGGSGGHIFPALSIANELRAEGIQSTFIGHGRTFNHLYREAGFDFLSLPASPWNGKNILVRLRSIVDFFRALGMCLKLYQTLHPAAVVGMGGYSSVAPIIAAKISGVPVAIHEQNARPGRANRLLAKMANRVLLAFDAARKHFDLPREKMRLVGNPVRSKVLEAMDTPRDDSKFHLLVVGGSQGARILSQVVPTAVAALSLELKQKLHVVQQARAEDAAAVKAAYTEAGIDHTVETFFTDLPVQMRRAHLLIARAGAGTVAECAVLRRVAIFVPLAIVDQKDNARVLADANAAVIMEEPVFTVERLTTELRDFMTKSSRLKHMEENTALIARPQAARESAAEILQLVRSDVMQMKPENAEDEAEEAATDVPDELQK